MLTLAEFDARNCGQLRDLAVPAVEAASCEVDDASANLSPDLRRPFDTDHLLGS